jgi:hypothetical protein
MLISLTCSGLGWSEDSVAALNAEYALSVDGVSVAVR